MDQQTSYDSPKKEDGNLINTSQDETPAIEGHSRVLNGSVFKKQNDEIKVEKHIV